MEEDGGALTYGVLFVVIGVVVGRLLPWRFLVLRLVLRAVLLEHGFRVA